VALTLYQTQLIFSPKNLLGSFLIPQLPLENSVLSSRLELLQVLVTSIAGVQGPFSASIDWQCPRVLTESSDKNDCILFGSTSSTNVLRMVESSTVGNLEQVNPTPK